MRMRRCGHCNVYTLSEKCKICGSPSNHVGPARYSPKDKYGRYRRQMREAMVDDGTG
jgi:H/ACA ribonucleoprotein complex subunit 3